MQWTKQVGGTIAKDEVAVVIETDKVSVDVRSTHSGIVTEVLVGVDTVVKVGDPLFKVDEKEGVIASTASNSNSAPAAGNIKDTPSTPSPPMQPSNAPSHHERQPSIQFKYGKGRVSRVHSSKVSDSPIHKGGEGKSTNGSGKSSVLLTGNVSYGRPAISEAEMEAISTGYYRM